MSIISVAANTTGATVTNKTVVKVNAIYQGNITLPAEARPLMRVSPVFTKPAALDAFGRPTTGQLVATSEEIEEWGRLAVTINGRNVSFFRGAATAITTLSWQRLGNYETAEIEIPSVSIFEEFGTGDLDWLTETGFLRIARVEPDNSTSTIWIGTINGITPIDGNIGIKISAHGLLFDATYKVMKPPVTPSVSELIEDIGYDISKSLNAVQGHWSIVPPTLTGVYASKEPSWETSLDYIKSLLSLAVTDSGNSWTVWLDAAARASIIKTSNIPGKKTVTLIAGQDGVQDGLNIDSVAGVTTIYGQGVSRDGAAWQNLKFPNRGTLPRFPLDNLDESFGQGSTNRSTASGTGVTDLKNRLVALNRYSNTYDMFGADLVDAVTKYQTDVGLPVTGSVDVATWNKLFYALDTTKGAYIAPLASVSAVQPRLYNEIGADIGPNPEYDPSIRPLEQHIDFGDGVSLAEAKRAAQAIINRDGSRPIEGSLTLTVCPQECSRFDLIPGDKVIYKGYRGQDVTLLIHKIEWSLDDESVRLSVSTRDMDYSELDAAVNRFRSANVGWSRTSGGVSSPVSVATGVGYSPIAMTPITPTTFEDFGGSTGGGTGGSGITGVIQHSSSFSVTPDYANKLVIITPVSMCNITLLNAGFTAGDQVHFIAVDTTSYVPEFGSGPNVQSFNGKKFAGNYATATAVFTGDNWVIAGVMRA